MRGSYQDIGSCEELGYALAHRRAVCSARFDHFLSIRLSGLADDRLDMWTCQSKCMAMVSDPLENRPSNFGPVAGAGLDSRGEGTKMDA